MALKRARMEAMSEHWNDIEFASGALGDVQDRNGEELFSYLAAKRSSGEFTAYDVAVLSHYISRTGGKGVEALALHPKQAKRHANEHVERVMKRTFKQPTLFRPYVPAFNKKLGRRLEEQMPVQLAHVQLNMEYAEFDTHDDNVELDPFTHEAYAEHPVRMQALADGQREGPRIFVLGAVYVRMTTSKTCQCFVM
jgi:hypothetical protein